MKTIHSGLEQLLNENVEVQTYCCVVKGRLVAVERSTESNGVLGNLLLEENGRQLLVRGSAIITIRRNKSELDIPP